VSQSGIATVTVIVIRDQAPQFTNLPRTEVADEADMAGKSIVQLSATDNNLIVRNSFYLFLLYSVVCDCVLEGKKFVYV
jgi:hypothetical protein